MLFLAIFGKNVEDAVGSHRRRIGYSQSCYNLSAMMMGSLRWMLSNDRQAAAAAGL
jgi:membrane associated rhomboid family serine protease